MVTENAKTVILIAEILRNIGTEKCLKKADAIESEPSITNVIHLRDLDLTASQMRPIAQAMGQEISPVKSVSCSHNPLIGDSGIITLIKHLPMSTQELGVVDCGLGDRGGKALLEWIKNAPQLQMLCMEGNSFSEDLIEEFKKFRKENAQILVVL